MTCNAMGCGDPYIGETPQELKELFSESFIQDQEQLET